MFNLLNKAFARTSRSAARRPAALKSRRLGVEKLDERVMLTATPTLSADGVLTVTGNAANDSVRVYHPVVKGRLDLTKIQVIDNTTRKVTTFTTSKVKSIEVNGGDGNDTLVNETAIRSVLAGNKGNDILRGGPGYDVLTGQEGNDVLYGSAGGDRYYGWEDKDVLHRNGTNASWTHASDSGDWVVGLGATIPNWQAPSQSQLTAQGDLMVSLDGNRLTFAGPSGLGFTLVSNWTKAGNGFQTTSNITMETRYGTVTLPNVAKIATKVETTAAVAGDAGVYKNITWGGIPTTGTTNPLNKVLDDATNASGLDVNLPGLNWGIGLGSKVKSLDSSAPLNDAVPYLYVRANTGYSVSYGSASVSAPNTYTGTFAFAPGDGTVYAAVGGLPVVGDLAVAVSPNGSIPYDPRLTNNTLGDNGVEFYGHLYVRGAVSLADAGVPIALNGEMVLNVDYNRDGSALGLTKANIARTVNSLKNGFKDIDGALANNVNAALSDVAIGFNGGLGVEFKVLSLNLGDASAWYKPGLVAMRAETANPFKGTIVEKFVPSTGRFEIEGHYRWGQGSTPDWYFEAVGVGGLSVMGMSGGEMYLRAGNKILNGGGIEAGAAIYGVGGLGRLVARGQIEFNGNFHFEARAQFKAELGSWAGIDVSGSVYFTHQAGSFSMGANLEGSVWVNGVVLQGGLRGKLGFDLAFHKAGTPWNIGFITIPRPVDTWEFSGRGELTAWVKLPGLSEWTATAGFEVSTTGITVKIPGLPDATFKW